MQFEISKRIRSSAPKHVVVDLLEEKLRSIASRVTRNGSTLEATGIEATFGSINRTDRANVSITEKDDGYLCVATVNYRPSVWFWVLTFFGIGTYVLWLIPVYFYISQKKMVREALEGFFARIDDEFRDAAPQRKKTRSTTEEGIAALHKLAELKAQGFVTDEEFAAKKQELLGL